MTVTEKAKGLYAHLKEEKGETQEVLLQVMAGLIILVIMQIYIM
jgi:hypothetical protein